MRNHKIAPARITLLREKKGWAQKDLAAELSKKLELKKALTAPNISLWETGRRPLPAKYLDALAALFNVEPSYLLGEEAVEVEEEKKIQISIENLYKYDSQPIFVVFKNFQHNDAWGIYDRENNRIVFKDFIFKLSSQTTPYINIFIMRPIFANELIAEGKKQLDLIRVLNMENVYISMTTSDKAIRSKYNGWYHHNEDHSCLINAIGLTLPYDGYGISYFAYAVDDYMAIRK